MLTLQTHFTISLSYWYQLIFKVIFWNYIWWHTTGKILCYKMKQNAQLGVLVYFESFLKLILTKSWQVYNFKWKTSFPLTYALTYISRCIFISLHILQTKLKNDQILNYINSTLKAVNLPLIEKVFCAIYRTSRWKNYRDC